ncbi:hypothetical protein ABZS52_31005 [Micromonospora profundi]|uniref:hypothetical protein n=1 Tax=Micromonospora profundi TaxID=1420889 RepID=UPI0033B6D760
METSTQRGDPQRGEDLVSIASTVDTVAMRLLRMFVWLAGGLAIAGLGYYFLRIGLDKADKAASAAGFFVGILGLGISVYNAVLASRSLARPRGTQAVLSSRVDGEVFQARGVKGSIKINSAPRGGGRIPDRVQASKSSKKDLTMDGQTVRDSDIRGPIRQLDEVGGDIEAEQ